MKSLHILSTVSYSFRIHALFLSSLSVFKNARTYVDVVFCVINYNSESNGQNVFNFVAN
jgi:hypothetical protein